MFNLSRKINDYELYKILDNNIINNMKQTILECFYLRDHKNGLGEKRLGRLCFNWIANNHPLIFIKIFKYIPDYGRWDDLLYITNTQLNPYIFQYISSQLNKDKLNMMLGGRISMCAKWMPTEGKSFAKKNKDKFQLLLKFLNLSPKEYRKLLSSLRMYLDINERYMCNNKFFLIKPKDVSKYVNKKMLKKKNPYDFKLKIKKKLNTSKYRYVLKEIHKLTNQIEDFEK